MGIIYIERAGSFKWKIIFVSKYICWILWWYLICVWYHLIIIWHIKEHCCELLLLVVFIFGNKASTACLIGGLSIKKVTTTYDIISDMVTSGSDLDSTANTGLPWPFTILSLSPQFQRYFVRIYLKNNINISMKMIMFAKYIQMKDIDNIEQKIRLQFPWKVAQL